MKEYDFITIPGAFNNLNLSASEKIALALVYGFDKSHNGVFYGSISYIQEWLGCSSKQTAITIMKKLIAKGYVVKGSAIIGGEVRRTYTLAEGVSKNWTGVQKLDLGSPKIGHNNIEDIYNNTLSIKGHPRFVKPSLEDIRLYCIERGNHVDAESFYNFYESKGWVIGKSPMKDWKAAVRTWEKRREEEKTQPASQPRKKESAFEHNLKVMDQMFGTNLHDQAYGKGGNR